MPHRGARSALWAVRAALTLSRTLHGGIDSRRLVGHQSCCSRFSGGFHLLARAGFPSPETLPKGPSFARVNAFFGCMQTHVPMTGCPDAATRVRAPRLRPDRQGCLSYIPHKIVTTYATYSPLVRSRATAKAAAGPDGHSAVTGPDTASVKCTGVAAAPARA